MTEAERMRYHEGRIARARGEERRMPDGRCSAKTRAAFYFGWDEEDRIRAERERPADAATPEDLRDFKSKCLALLQGEAVCDEARRLIEAAAKPDGLRELLAEISE